MDYWTNGQDDFLDFQKQMPSSPQLSHSHPHPHPQSHSNGQPAYSNGINQVSSSSLIVNTANSSANSDTEQLKLGFTKMLLILERLEQRIAKVEQTTFQILKTQQETLTVPFMSQSELDKARQVAEQMEQDSSVAKQLQAAYNKEIELKKNMSSTNNYYQPHYGYNNLQSVDCPICGSRVKQMDIEAHVDSCLAMIADDPKRAIEAKEVKKKIDSGFFSRLFKTNTKTETTKVITTTQSESATAPLLANSIDNHTNSYEGANNGTNLYPPFSYHPHPMSMPPHNINIPHNVPMMMPMYMYPSYPSHTQLQEKYE